jgi:tetratricopeptide (TPR) repeat protein
MRRRTPADPFSGRQSAILTNSQSMLFCSGIRPQSTLGPLRWAFTLGAALAVLATSPAATAQPDDGSWRTDVIKALRAAGEKDYPGAEQAFVQALKEAERFGPEDTRVGTTLNSLGLVYRAEKKYSEAEAAYRRALVIMNAAYGDSVDVGNVNFNIASVMFDQGHQVEALPNLRTTLGIYERLLGSGSLKTAAALCMEGDAFRMMQRYPESEDALRRCADTREKDSGLEDHTVADALHSLSLTLIAEGKFSAAEPRLKLVEKIREKTLGITSPLLAQTMEDHASVLKELGRAKEAERLTIIAAAIRRSQKGK